MRATSAALCAAAAALAGAATADVSMCLGKDGKTSPCGPGNQMCPPGPFGPDTPQFHVKDESCGENDPNGPSYDPVHGTYHLHYQNHVGLHGGRTYGHAVSKDFTHWAHMPDSIWNDKWYDSSAIYTGSATVVDGKVVQVYPGLCKTGTDGCPGGTNLCIAVPSNPGDPLQTNWTKDVYATNPIVNATGRDPSTAWKTPAGEWRLTTFDTIIMGSLDFKTWYRIGKQPGFPGGECPSFFPLPASTPGAGPAPAGAATPTHVHKASHGGKDWMMVGTYVANGIKQNGDWNATVGVSPKEICIDAGALYASKDFYDPTKKRRINWGWARVPPSSTQTLPREVTWHPELQQLVYSPVEEQDALRGASLASFKATSLSANKPHSLSIKGTAGDQAEIRVSFLKPAAPTRLSVWVMAPAAGKGTEFFVQYTPGTKSVTVGSGKNTGVLNLLASDKTIDLTLYVDKTFTEAYWMNGRVAMTIVTPRDTQQNGVFLEASAAAEVASADAWAVNPIWVSPEQVIATPRVLA